MTPQSRARLLRQSGRDGRFCGPGRRSGSMICLKPSFCFTLRAHAGSSRASSTPLDLRGNQIFFASSTSTSPQASTVWPYKKVRYGPTKGDIYLKNAVTRYQQSAAYWQTYWQSMGWLFLVICCLTLINCFTITTTRLDKKV